MKNLFDSLLAILKDLDWKEFLYKAYTGKIRPKLEEYVKNTASKWDDVALNAADVLIDKFIKP